MISFDHSARRSVVLALALLGCTGPAVTTTPPPIQATVAPSSVTQAASSITEADVRRLLTALADDSLEGRGTGTRGSAKAAALIANEMRAAGLEPAGDSGFFQRVPVAMVARRMRDGSMGQGLSLLSSLADLDTIPAAQRRAAVNVLGLIRGTDPVLKDSDRKSVV